MPSRLSLTIFLTSLALLGFALVAYMRLHSPSARDERMVSSPSAEPQADRESASAGRLSTFLRRGVQVTYAYTYRSYSAGPDGTPEKPEAVLVLEAELLVRVVEKDGKPWAEVEWQKSDARIGSQKIDGVPAGRTHVIALNERGFPISFEDANDTKSTLGMHPYNLIGLVAADDASSSDGSFWRSSSLVPLRVIEPDISAPKDTPGFLSYQVLVPEEQDGKRFERIARLWRIRIPDATGTKTISRDDMDNAVFVLDPARGQIVRGSGRLIQSNFRLHSDGRRELLTTIMHEYTFQIKGQRP